MALLHKILRGGNCIKANLLLLVVCAFYCINVHAQTADSLPKAQKGFFKQWWLAGINISGAGTDSKNTDKTLSFFQKAASNSLVSSKIQADLRANKNFKNSNLSFFGDVQNVFSLDAVFKPKVLEEYRLLSYAEVLAGIGLSNNLSDMSMDADSIYNDSMVDYFTASYSNHINTLNLHFAVTLQTPTFAEVLSFYGGLGVFGSIDVFKSVTASESILKRGNYKSSISPSTIAVLSDATNGFSVSSFSGGIYIPIGLRVNVSQHSNLFLEFMARCNNSQMPSGWHTQWYRGWGVGYRYKFLSKTDRNKDYNNEPASPPAPFY